MPHNVLLTQDGKSGLVQPARYDAVLMEMFRTFPGKRRWVNGKLHFEDLHSNWRHVFLLIPDATYSEAAATRVRVAQEALAAREALLERQREGAVLEGADWCFRRKPFAHQLKAWAVSRDQTAFAYFMEMGTGKSKVTIDVMAWLYLQAQVNLVVVIAPNGVHEQWVDQQLPEHMPVTVEYAAMAVRLSKSRTKAAQERLRAVLSSGKLVVVTINAEALSHQSGADLVQDILRSSKKSMLVVDESSRFSNPAASRTKALMKLRQFTKYRRILSGTPVTRGLEDLYAQFLFLDPDILGNTTFTGFRAEYCLMGGFEGREIVGYRNEEKLQRKIAPVVFTARKEDCLDLPPKVYVQDVFDLPPEHMQFYQTVKQEALAVCDKAIVGGQGELDLNSSGLTFELTPQGLYFKLMQVAAGFLLHKPDPDQKHPEIIWRADPNVRLERLSARLQELGGDQSIIWFRYQEDYRALAELLTKAKISFSSYYGGIKQSDRSVEVEKFMSGRNQIFLGQEDAAGTGLNLQAARSAIYYTNSPNPESRWQSEDRIHRIGQTLSCTYIDLVARRTVDVNTINNLSGKQKISLRTYAGLKQILMEEPILLQEAA